MDLPPAVAVIVYVCRRTEAVGVPEICPVPELKTSPAGSAGEMENVADVVPERLGVIFGTAWPTEATIRDFENERTSGSGVGVAVGLGVGVGLALVVPLLPPDGHPVIMKESDKKRKVFLVCSIIGNLSESQRL